MPRLKITDEQAALARRLHAPPSSLSYDQIAKQLGVSYTSLLRRCDRVLAARTFSNFKIKEPAPPAATLARIRESRCRPLGRRANLSGQFRALHVKNPTWHAGQLAEALQCDEAYVRAMAYRLGLTLPKKPRPKKYNKSGTPAAERFYYVSMKDQLVDLFFEFFDEHFVDRAVFEPRLSLYDEFRAARHQVMADLGHSTRGNQASG